MRRPSLSVTHVTTYSLACCLLALWCSTVSAQLVEAPESSQLEIVYLRHAAAADVAMAVTRLFTQRDGAAVDAIAEERLNAIIIRAPKDLQKEVMELIASLDKDANVEQQVKIFSLQNTEPSSGLLQTLAAAVDDRTRLSYDKQRNSVLAVGPASSLAIIEAALLRMDEGAGVKPEEAPTKRQNIQVRIVWLATGLEDKSATEPPKDLEPVMKELERVGITNLQMAAQLLVSAIDGEEFHASGSASFEQACDLTVSGMLGDPRRDQVIARPDSDAPKLTLDVSATTHDSRPMSLCQLQTSIKAPIGQSVVLGVTPINSKQSVFVVQVMATK